MTRTAICYTLSAFAALALVTTFASSAMSEQRCCGDWDYSYGDTMVHEQGKPKTPKGLATKKHGQKTPEGLATKKGPKVRDGTSQTLPFGYQSNSQIQIQR